MAGSDYYSCDVCGGKSLYDAELNYNPDTEQYDGVGDIACICEECAKTHEVVVRTKAHVGDKLQNFKLLLTDMLNAAYELHDDSTEEDAVKVGRKIEALVWCYKEAAYHK